MKVKCGIYKYTEVEIEIDDKFEPLTHPDYDWNEDDTLMDDFYDQYYNAWGQFNSRILNQLPNNILLTYCCIKSLDGNMIAES